MTIVRFLVLWEKPCMEGLTTRFWLWFHSHASIELQMKPCICSCIDPRGRLVRICGIDIFQFTR
jgi:hypothetical protein